MMNINDNNHNLQLQRYEIIEKIGEGGMADVYRAYDKVLQRECAIKILREDLNNNQIALLRFQREADAASKLHHPNIVQIYDVGETNNRNFIVMEYVHGKTLKTLIQQRGAIEKKEAVFIMQQIVEAMVLAHQNGVIHRDIKPQNIMIKADGQVKITDFGIAMTQGSVQLTAHDSVMGSVHYMAPECARGEQASEQADIYSMGIVFYEMLTGEVPFKGDGAVQIAMKHLQEELKPVREYNGTIEQSIENIIIKATAKNKNLRYQSAQEMLEDIKLCFDPSRANVKKLVLELPVENNTTRVFSEIKEEVVNEKVNERNWWLIGAIALVSLALIVLITTTLLGGQKKSTLIRVPDVTNIAKDAAMQQLTKANLVVVEPLIYEENTTIDKEHVIRTEPSANSEVEPETLIRIYVSQGEFLQVEDYTGRLLVDVEAIYANTKIKIDVNYEKNSNVAENTIVKQSGLEVGTRVDPEVEGTLVLFVAQPTEFVIPDLINVNINTAKGLLEQLGANVELKPLSTDDLSDEEFSKIKTLEVIRTIPEKDATYIQKQDNHIVLEYYEQTKRVIPNKTRLKDTISKAKAIDRSKYESETLDLLDRALERANQVAAADKQSQATVDDAANNLQAAIDNLRIIVDKKPLQDSLETLKAVNTSQLTTEQLNLRDETITDTNFLLNKTGVTQAELDAQVKVVLKVIDDLKVVVETPVVESPDA